MKDTTQFCYVILVLTLIFYIYSEKTSVKNVFGKFGSVKIDLDASAGQWTKSWPDGIKLVNNVESSRRSITILPKLSSFQNLNGYPYSFSSSSDLNKQSRVATTTLITPRRTYTWQADDLIISVNMTSLNNPCGTRLVPPITWLSASGSKVKVLQQQTDKAVFNTGNSNIDTTSTNDIIDKVEVKTTLRERSSSAVDSFLIDMNIKNKEWQEKFYKSSLYSESKLESTSIISPNTINNNQRQYGFGSAMMKKNSMKDSDSSDNNIINNNANNNIDTAKEQKDTQEYYNEGTENGEDTERVIEITVRKKLAEDSLSCLRMFGFNRSDIYRMLDKGPWILAFDISKVLPRLYSNIKTDLGLNQTETVHILSHCPYLIAQYHRYKGRDVSATARALIGAGYLPSELNADLRRFPSMLSAPPDRILGWMNLLSAYGIASEPGQFGKYVRRAPFMFNINAPQIFDSHDTTTNNNNNNNIVSSSNNAVLSVSTTASEYVAYDALAVLDLLWDLRVTDLNKVMRTQPLLLITNIKVLKDRINYLSSLLEYLNNELLQNSNMVENTTANVNSTDNDDDDDNVTHESSSYSDNSNNNKNNRKNSLNSKNTLNKFRNMNIASNSYRELDIIYCQSSSSSSSNVNNSNSNGTTTLLEQYKSPEIQKALSSLILTYPAILSIEKSQMIAAVAALYEEGLSLFEIVKLIRLFPPLLSKSSATLKGCVYFLKQYCGLRKLDLYPFLQRNPNILSTDISTFAPKKDYLFKSLGGTTSILKRCPAYLCYDLDTHIIPRAEFVRALGKDPLFYGLSFLVNSKEKDLAYAVGSTSDVYNEFKMVFGKKWLERKTSIKGIVTATKSILNTVSSEVNNNKNKISTSIPQ